MKVLFSSSFQVALSAFVLMSLVGISLGNIGETKDELRARYGPPKETGVENIYTRGDFFVNVFFDSDQRSAMEIFSKRVTTPGSSANPTSDGKFVVQGTNSEEFDKQPELSQKEIDQILKDNGGKYGWGGLRSSGGADFWYRGDRKVVAQYKKKEKALVLMSIGS